MAYAITIAPYNGSYTRLTWTFPDDIGNHLPGRDSFLFLQRSPTKNDWPLQPDTMASTVVSNTPTPEAGWTTIQSWTITTPAQLAAAATYDDHTAPAPTFYYRLIIYQEKPGGNYKEWDWLPVTTGPGVTVPGSVTWAKGTTGAGCYGVATCSDSAGNVYTTGPFSGTVDFGGTSLTAVGGQDVFVTKHSPAGALLFAKQFGTGGGPATKCICLDPSGNIFIGGNNLPGGALIKLNASGVQQWVKGPVPAGLQQVTFTSIAAASDGSIAATGSFVAGYPNTMEFGDSHPLQSVSGSTDAFLAQYAADGTCNWAQNFVNWGDTEYGTAVIVDRAHSDNIFLAGYSISGIQIGGMNLSNIGSGTSGYLAKFDSSGALIGALARAIGTNGGQGGYSRLNGMTLDSAGNPIVCGAFNSHADFGGGDRYRIAAQQTAWVAKYNGNTLAWIWDLVVDTPAPLYVNFQSVAVDLSNNVYLTGSFKRSFTVGSKTLTALTDLNNTQDILVIKATAAGAWPTGSNAAWAMRAGSSNEDLGNGIAFSAPAGPVVTGGFFNNVNGSQADFGSRFLTAGPSGSCFIMLLAS